MLCGHLVAHRAVPVAALPSDRCGAVCTVGAAALHVVRVLVAGGWMGGGERDWEEPDCFSSPSPSPPPPAALQILLNGTWPALTPQTYYHVVLAPGSPLTGALPNGVYWSGIPYGTPQVTTSASVHGDPLLFTGEDWGRGREGWLPASVWRLRYTPPPLTRGPHHHCSPPARLAAVHRELISSLRRRLCGSRRIPAHSGQLVVARAAPHVVDQRPAGPLRPPGRRDGLWTRVRDADG